MTFSNTCYNGSIRNTQHNTPKEIVMKKFRMTVKSDNGTDVYNMYATDKCVAKKCTCAVLGCPERAIKKVKRVE